MIQDLRFLQQCIEDEAALEKTLMPEEPSISGKYQYVYMRAASIVKIAHTL